MTSIDNNEQTRKCLKTDWPIFDSLTDGLNDGCLIYMASRPSMGKTCLTLSIINRAAIPQKKRVAFFSLELTKENLALMLLSQLSGVDLANESVYGFQQHHWTDLQNAAGLLAKSNIFIDDTPKLSPSQIHERCDTLIKKEGRLDLIVVDYFQLLEPDRHENEDHPKFLVAQKSRYLKKLARSLECPVLVLCQLPKEVDTYKDPRPTLSDMKWIGPLEEQADIILFPFRENYYDQNIQKEIMELNVAKSRRASTGTTYIQYKTSKTGLIFGEEVN